MSAVSKEAGGSNQDFDLNIAPIIDCFTVLITYLLVSASFLTFNILDVGVAANGVAPPAETAATDPPVNFALEITAQKVVKVKITGGPKGLDLTYPVQPFTSGDWEVRSVVAKVGEEMALYPAVQEISITADSSVRYKEIIQIIDPIRKIMPKVFLSGR